MSLSRMISFRRHVWLLLFSGSKNAEQMVDVKERQNKALSVGDALFFIQRTLRPQCQVSASKEKRKEKGVRASELPAAAATLSER